MKVPAIAMFLGLACMGLAHTPGWFWDPEKRQANSVRASRITIAGGAPV